MTLLSQVWHGFWFAQTGLHGLLFCLLIWRKLYKELPIFFAYVGFATLQTAVMLGMNYAPSVSGDQYYAAYVGGTGVLAALSFGVVYEILTHLLRNYPVLRRLGTRSFRWATVVLIVVALLLAWFAPASGGGHLMATVFVLRRTADLLLCGLLLFLVVFPRCFGLSSRSYLFGIALGLGILASAELGSYAIRSQIEPITRNLSEDVLEAVTQSATLFSVLVWIAYLFAPEPGPQNVLKKVPEHDLETWNQELERLLHQ
jgi:hypothetical protein